jgi:hypothetical protein
MKIASIEDRFPRGTVIGRQITGPPLSEAEHFRKCSMCGGYVDMRDRVWIEDHQGPLPHRRAIGCSRA